MVAKTAGKKPPERVSTTTRKRRIIWALTPKRVKRAHARWTRRGRKVKKRYAAFRAVIKRDQTVTCMECGRKVPKPNVRAHLARHKTQTVKAESAVEKARATAARRHARQAAKATRTPGDGDGSRGGAAPSASPWVAVGGVLVAVATQVEGLGSPWLVAAGVGCGAVGIGAYAVGRQQSPSTPTQRSGNSRQRPNGSSGQQAKSGRQRQQAPSCSSSACANSTRPVTKSNPCDCACKGRSHGHLAKRRTGARP